MARAPLAVAQDESRTNEQRTYALDRLREMGISVNSMMKDQNGVVTNLTEATKEADAAYKDFAKRMEGLSEAGKVRKMAEDLEALTKAEELYAKTSKELAEADSANSAALSSADDLLGDKPADLVNTSALQKKQKEDGDILNQAQQNADKLIQSFQSMNETQWRAAMANAGATKQELLPLDENRVRRYDVVLVS